MLKMLRPQSIIAISAVAIGFLIWLIYFHQGLASTSTLIGHLPALNALLNGLSATSLAFGLAAILKRKREIHKKWMVSAFIFSTLFLVSYIIYHTFHGDSHFLGTGWIRPVYFFILISHILLSVVALPIVLTTFAFALQSNFSRHKKLAKWTWPLWMYVSVTGVLVYLFLRFYN